jgi:hypothetical protein
LTEQNRFDAGTSSLVESEDEFAESIENSIDRMRDEGGIAPEIPHTDSRSEEIQKLYAAQKDPKETKF